MKDIISKFTEECEKTPVLCEDRHKKRFLNVMKKRKAWDKYELIDLFNELIPNFNHKETGKILDNKM